MVIAHHVVAYTWRCYDQSETLKVKALDVSFFDERKNLLLLLIHIPYN